MATTTPTIDDRFQRLGDGHYRIEAGDAHEIQSRLDVDAWHQANVAEAAEAESMQAFFAAWPLGKSNPATKYPEGRP